MWLLSLCLSVCLSHSLLGAKIVLVMPKHKHICVLWWCCRQTTGIQSTGHKFICFRFPIHISAMCGKFLFELIWDMSHILLLYLFCYFSFIIIANPKIMHSFFFFSLILLYRVYASIQPTPLLYPLNRNVQSKKKHCIFHLLPWWFSSMNCGFSCEETNVHKQNKAFASRVCMFAYVSAVTHCIKDCIHWNRSNKQPINQHAAKFY